MKYAVVMTNDEWDSRCCERLHVPCMLEGGKAGDG
jgi:hypothetical protein